MRNVIISFIAAAFVLGAMPADAKGKGKGKPPAPFIKK